jgi:SAM-dependent methyltransferase
MSADSRDIASHYTRGDLLARLDAALRDDGVDPARPTIETLAPYDQFHGRGMEATVELADLMPARPSDHILDVGSGIGGPARFVARRLGCRVTGIDLTPEFCDVARHLTGLLGLTGLVSFETADALAMPFPDRHFDGLYSMNVSMNIADKAALYRELYRVLKPEAWMLLSEVAKGEGGDVDYPTPWAARASASFLSTPDDTRRGLLAAGFDVVRIDSTLAKALAFGDRSRAMAARGEKPPHRAVMLIHGEIARDAMANTARALADAKIVPIEVVARKRPNFNAGDGSACPASRR